MLGYLLRKSVLGWLAVLGLAAAVIQFFLAVINVRWVPRFEAWTSEGEGLFAIIGVFLAFLWWLLAFKLAVEALRVAAAGPQRASQRDRWVDDEQGLQHLLLWGGLLLAGYALYLLLGALALAAYGLLVVLLLPGVLVLLGMEESLKRAFEPGAWSLLLEQVGADYLLVTAKLLALVVVLAFVQMNVIPSAPRWLHWTLAQMAWVLALFAGYHELGRMVGEHRAALAARSAPEPSEAAQLTQEEELAMLAAGRYGAEQRFPRAARELESLACRPGVTPAVHARYRELLFLSADAAGLMAHARSYIPELLSLGQTQAALAMYQDSHGMDEGFELAEAAPLTRLIAVALDEREVQLAIELAREFLRRFPDDEDAVRNGLAAARQLDRLGRDEEARQWLVSLVRRFPRHPLRAELVAALETLESVARRGG